MNTDDIVEFDRYQLRVKLRQSELHKVKPDKVEVLKKVDGKVFTFQASWIMEPDHHLYPNEWAMSAMHDPNWPVEAPTWIASGDLENP